MNNRTTYEITIADKLQQLPLPDREDAIWARIKTGLDLDMPEGEGGNSGPQAPSGGWMWSAGMLLFVGALLAVFILLEKTKHQPNLPNNTTPSTESVTTPLSTPLAAPPLPADRSNEALPSNNRAVSDARLVRPDSTNGIAAPLIVQPLPDTLLPVTVLTPAPLAQDSLPGPKPKTRGIPTITDADYRIVPAKRDST